MEIKTKQQFNKFEISSHEDGRWFGLARDKEGKHLLDKHGNGIECCLSTQEEVLICLQEQLQENGYTN